MVDIDDYRKRIDELDKEIIKFFEEWMDSVINVVNYKMENNLFIFDRSREDEVVEKNLGYLNNKDYVEEIKKFFVNLMEVFREL